MKEKTRRVCLFRDDQGRGARIKNRILNTRGVSRKIESRNAVKMGLDWLWMIGATLLGCYVLVYKILRRMNGWYYHLKLGKKQYRLLPPGDMGWPLIGNLLAFTRAFTSADPDSFVNSLVSKYGRSGIYKTHLFGNPSVIICTPEMCRRVLTDDESFIFGYPKSTAVLAGTRSLNYAPPAEHRRLRRLTTAPIIGHNALAMYIERIEHITISTLEELSTMNHPVQLLKEMKNITFKVIVHIFLGSYDHSIVTKIGDLFTDTLNAVFSLPINVPGFAFHKALKSRGKLGKIIQSVVDERRTAMKSGEREEKKDLMDILLDVEDDGLKLEDEDIVSLLVSFLLAGHETSAIGTMWSMIYLTEHPQIMKKAKEEQEEIMKTRLPSQKQLSLKEIKQMVYLSKVIDEMLRRTNIGFSIFREATVDVNINGYIIPKGWRVLTWSRAVHMDPEYYPNPREFNPSRWDDFNAKAGSFIPFGAGSRLCPGIDLTKLEISIFLHYFLLGYKLERVNPECPVTYLPLPKPTDNCLGKVIKVCSSE